MKSRIFSVAGSCSWHCYTLPGNGKPGHSSNQTWVQCSSSGPGAPLAVADFKVTAWMSLWGTGSPALLSTTPRLKFLAILANVPLCVLFSLASLIIGVGLAHCSWFEGVSQNCHLFMGGYLSFFLFGYAACRISILLPGIELGLNGSKSPES